MVNKNNNNNNSSNSLVFGRWQQTITLTKLVDFLRTRFGGAKIGKETVRAKNQFEVG